MSDRGNLKKQIKKNTNIELLQLREYGIVNSFNMKLIYQNIYPNFFQSNPITLFPSNPPPPLPPSQSTSNNAPHHSSLNNNNNNNNNVNNTNGNSGMVATQKNFVVNLNFFTTDGLVRPSFFIHQTLFIEYFIIIIVIISQLIEIFKNNDIKNNLNN